MKNLKWKIEEKTWSEASEALLSIHGDNDWYDITVCVRDGLGTTLWGIYEVIRFEHFEKLKG